MSARQRRYKVLSGGDYTLTSGLHAYQGEAAFYNTATNLVVVGVAGTTTLLFLGFFKRECDASSGAATCQLEFPVPRVCEWFDNYASDPVVAADVGSLTYIHTGASVRHTATSNAVAGLVMELSTTEGVLVDTNFVARATTATPTITDFTNATHGHTNNAGGGVLAAPAITSFASATHAHDTAAHGGTIRWADGGTLAFTGVTCTVTTPGTWTHYRAPAAATQASVIALGNTDSVMGDTVKITSAGSITCTITYYDGTYARTAALSASKTHHVIASYDGAVWTFESAIGAN